MKNFSAAAAVALILAALATTGFQCGSAEMTSAKLYMQRGEWDKAETALVKEVEKNPASAESWYLLGDVRRNRKNYAGMVEAFDQSLKSGNAFEPQITNARKSVWARSLNAGAAAFNVSRKQERTDSTARLYRRSIEDHHQLLDTAAEYAQIGPSESDTMAFLRKCAIDEYRTGITALPDSAVTYYYLGLAYMADGRTDDEIGAFEDGMKHGPSADLRTSLINAYITKGQDAETKGDKAASGAAYGKALDALKEARTADPGNTELLGTMIKLYTQTNRAAEAKPYMYQALAADPGNKSYNYNLGVLIMQDPGANADSLSAAIGHFEKAIAADPSFDEAIQNAGIAYVKRGDLIRKGEQEAAEKKKGATADPKKWTDDFKKAAGYFKTLTERKPTDEKIWDALATAYANANMLAQAKDAMKKADELRKK